MRFNGYDTGPWFDELFQDGSQPRAEARQLIETIEALEDGELGRLQESAHAAMVNLGITFNVYSDGAGVERVLPFDIIPRVVQASEWDTIERGLRQRIYALNLFLDDVYHDAKILRDGVVPRELGIGAPSCREQCAGLNPPRGIWCHITGTDLVRDRDGAFYVLEDNLRCPSGVSYVLENRRLMKRTYPDLFQSFAVRSVDDYASRLLDVLSFVSPRNGDRLRAGVLTPGVFNSAYFEHSYLAQQMGIELVEGRDLIVADDTVYMRTTNGLQPVDVLYRRIDDDFIDPRPGRIDGSAGIGRLPRGKSAPANALARVSLTTGYARAGDHPLLPVRGPDPTTPTYLPWREKDMGYVWTTSGSWLCARQRIGRLRLIVGPHATRALRGVRSRCRTTRRNFIAQLTLVLSRAPVSSKTA